MHVFPDCAQHVLVLDAARCDPLKTPLDQARQLLGGQEQGAPLCSPTCSAPPQQHRAARGRGAPGSAWSPASTSPMLLLRCVCYRSEALDALVQRAVVGGTQG